MSIVTKTGDDGTTGLMFGKRVSKTDQRLSAFGAVDELNANLGLARSLSQNQSTAQELFRLQKELVILMGELSVLGEDRQRYQDKGFHFVNETMVNELENKIKAVEAHGVSFQGWDTPGANPAAAALHMGRTICRRAEREVWALKEKEEISNVQITLYLNRLSDWLWLLAQASNKSL